MNENKNVSHLEKENIKKERKVFKRKLMDKQREGGPSIPGRRSGLMKRRPSTFEK